MDGGQFTVSCGFDIERRVANHDRSFGFSSERARDEMGELWLRFAPGVDIGAEDAVDEMINF